MAMDKEAVRALLPNVGDELIEKPHLHKSLGIGNPRPQKCVVVYVNREHLWYKVRFNNGTYECYKAPSIIEKNRGGWDSK